MMMVVYSPYLAVRSVAAKSQIAKNCLHQYERESSAAMPGLGASSQRKVRELPTKAHQSDSKEALDLMTAICYSLSRKGGERPSKGVKKVKQQN